MVLRAGVEPATSGLEVPCSIQLSYRSLWRILANFYLKIKLFFRFIVKLFIHPFQLLIRNVRIHLSGRNRLMAEK